MANGDTLLVLTAQMGVPPDANMATPDVRQGGSANNELVPVLDFDAGTDEFVDFVCVLPRHYGGNGLDVTLVWMASSATSGNVVWQAAMRRLNDDAEDLDGTHTYSFNTVTAGAPSASGEQGYDTIQFTNGADMHSVAAGEAFLLRVGRDANNGSDTMSGDAELVAVEVRETA